MPSDKDLLMVLLGAALYVILMHHSETLRTLSVEDIEGIDLQSLKICHERGLI